MSKKVIFRSVAAVAVVGFVLMFSSCKKTETEDPKKEEPKEEPKEQAIVGTWKYEKAELKELKCENPAMEPFLMAAFQEYGIAEAIGEGLDGVYEFTKDGTVIFTTSERNEVSSYQVNDKKLTIIGSDNFLGTFDFSISGETMYWDMDIMEIAANEEEGSEMLEQLSEVGVTKFVIRITLKKQKK